MLNRTCSIMLIIGAMLYGCFESFAQQDEIDVFERINRDLTLSIENPSHEPDTPVWCYFWSCPFPNPSPQPRPCPKCMPGFQIILQDDWLEVQNEDLGYILPLGTNLAALDFRINDGETLEPLMAVGVQPEGLFIYNEQTAEIPVGMYQWEIADQDDILVTGWVYVVAEIPEVIETYAHTDAIFTEDALANANVYGYLSLIDASQWHFGDALDKANRSFDFAIQSDSNEWVYNSWLLNNVYMPPTLRDDQEWILPNTYLDDIPVDIRNGVVEDLIFEIETGQ